MSVNYLDLAVDLARRRAAMSRTHDTCGDCGAKIPAGGDLLCPTCRAREQREFEERLARADSYRYERVEQCAACLLGRATADDPLCVSCRHKRETHRRAMAKVDTQKLKEIA